MNENLFVTDTHALLYFFCGAKKKLGTRAKKAFEDAITNKQTVIFVPSVVFWEVSMLVSNGTIKLSKPFDEWIDDLFTLKRINPWPFDHDTAKFLHKVVYHNDPFDRAIVATALQLEMPLITNDELMHESKPCDLVWD